MYITLYSYKQKGPSKWHAARLSGDFSAGADADHGARDGSLNLSSFELRVAKDFNLERHLEEISFRIYCKKYDVIMVQYIVGYVFHDAI